MLYWGRVCISVQTSLDLSNTAVGCFQIIFHVKHQINKPFSFAATTKTFWTNVCGFKSLKVYLVEKS